MPPRRRTPNDEAGESPSRRSMPYDLRRTHIPRTIPRPDERAPNEPPGGSYMPACTKKAIAKLKERVAARPSPATPEPATQPVAQSATQPTAQPAAARRRPVVGPLSVAARPQGGRPAARPTKRSLADALAGAQPNTPTAATPRARNVRSRSAPFEDRDATSDDGSLPASAAVDASDREMVDGDDEVSDMINQMSTDQLEMEEELVSIEHKIMKLYG